MPKSYTLPQMPLTASVWHNVLALPIADQPDEILAISLSPIKPGEAMLPTGLLFNREPTHIIRCMPNQALADNAELGESTEVFPTSVFEYPVASGHYYVSLWYHECGAGFPNHHARVYVSRMGQTPQQNTAKYVGWV